MEEEDSLRYVPQRSVDSVYMQRRLGPTPFSSALRPEPTDSALGSGVGGSSNPVSALAADQTHEKMTYRMNYPVCVVRGGPIFPQDTLRCVPPVRSAADPNAVDDRAQPMQVRPGVLSGPKPNPHWQKAPPPDPAAEARAARALGLPNLKHPLPRDTVHPLISSLQADANRVARELHPEAGLLSNAKRDAAPCTAHQHAAAAAGATGLQGGEQQTALGIPLRSGGGGGGFGGGGGSAGSGMAVGLTGTLDGVDDDDDASYGGGGGGRSGGGGGGASSSSLARRRRPHDQRSPLGRAFAAEGGMRDASEYSDNVQHFAQSMPGSLTSIAAKALASALHDQPVSTVPALAGKGNSVSMPPAPAFRGLNPVARAVLSKRSRDTRHLLERVICESVPLSAPPPNELTQAVKDARIATGNASEDEDDNDNTGSRGGNSRGGGGAGGHSAATLRADEVEMGEALRVPIDLSPLFTAGGGLHAWDLATAALRGAALSSDGIATSSAHTTASLVAGGRGKIKSVTTQTASLFSSATPRPKLVQYLTEVGIRTGDSLYQILAPSQSEFTRRPERAGQLRQFGNTNETPGNTYGFDTGRFSVLLENCGFDVEEASLNGATFLDAATMRLFGQHSPFLRLFDVSGCVHLDGKDIAAALARSRQSLRLLNISNVDNITGAGLDEILPGLSNLVALCMSGLNRLVGPADDYAFLHLCGMKTLRVLDVSYCSNIGDAALVSAAQGCPSLEYVDMRGCLNVTDAGVAAIASYCSQLRCWRLSYCSKLTAASMVLLTRTTGKKLEVLCVDGMSRGVLTEPVLAAAIERGANLALLSIAGTSNAQLTDESLASIVRSCPKLHALDVSGSRNFSIAALTDTIHELKQLRRLVVSASGMSKDQIDLLKMVRECVEVVDFEPTKAAPTRMFGIKQPPPPPPPAKKVGQRR